MIPLHTTFRRRLAVLGCFAAVSGLCFTEARAAEDRVAVGAEALRLELDRVQGQWRERNLSAERVTFPLEGSLWEAETAAGWIAPGPADRVTVKRDRDGTASSVEFSGSTDDLAWTVAYKPQGPRIVKSLSVTARRDVTLKRVALWRAVKLRAAETASTPLQDIAVFYRNGPIGFFASLDFPYSNIVVDGDSTRVSYPPFLRLKAGEKYATHTLTLGATALSGENRYGRDTGEVAAMDAYVQERFTPRFDRPMFVGCSIVNRYTMPQGGIIWYSYFDHPTLSRNTNLLKRDLDYMPKLGMEYFQVFPGIFDWAPGDPEPKTVHQIVNYARKRGVRIGDYSGTNSVFCPHYNEHGNTLDHPEWRMRDAAGNAGGFCFGCPQFMDYYTSTVTRDAAEYKFKLHCMDFLSLAPCFAENHGHPAGPESLYQQVLGLTKFMEALSAVNRDMMIWSNSGNWSEFLPKIAWWNHNLYLTDPAISTPWQGLNMTSLLDDARREQMVALHYTRFAPYRFYTNCQYFFSQNSIVPDIRAYKFGALSTLAVTPNLSLAEVRPWLDRLSARDLGDALAFYQTWTRCVTEHYDLWKRTYHTGDDPAPGGVEVYSHAAGAHGFVFVVNPNFWEDTADVALDPRLGFDAQGRCEVRELYPTDQFFLPDAGPYPDYGSTLRVRVPGREVLVLEVRPEPERLDAPRVYGAPGTIKSSADGYVLRTRGRQGARDRIAVVTPDGKPVAAATVNDDDPPQPKRLFAKTGIEPAGGEGSVALFDVTFRRTSAPTDLRNWRACPATFEDGVARGLTKGFTDGTAITTPLWKGVSRAPVTYAAAQALGAGPIVNFCGGYIENAFSEWQETTIHLQTAANASRPAAPAPSQSPAPAESSETAKSPGETWWISTAFDLPFMYTIGAEPAFDEHPLVVFPMLDPAKIAAVKGWINGAPLDVRRYAYPRNPALATWWADLVGTGAHGGANTLALYIAFAK